MPFAERQYINMKKSDLHKPIIDYLSKHGYEKVNELCYSILSQDNSVKYIIRMPDMINGFIIGAQFINYGEFDGDIKNAPMKNFEFEMLLIYAKKYDYKLDEIMDAIKIVCDKMQIYIKTNRSEIKSHLNEWTFGLYSEKEKNDILSCLGLPILNPYSIEYLKETANKLKKNQGCISFPFDEYYQHKDYYDEYITYGCKVVLDKKLERVMIIG